MKKNQIKVCWYWQYQCYFVGVVVFSDQPKVRISPLFGTEEGARNYMEWWLEEHHNRDYYEII